MPVEGTGHVQRGDNIVVLLFPPQPLVQPVSRFFYLALALSHLSIGEPGSFVLPARIQSARSKGKVRVHKDHIPARLRLQGKRSCSRLSSFNFRSPLNYLLPLFLSLSVSWSVPYAIFFFFSAPSNVHPFFEQPESNVCFLALSESAWKWEEHRMKHTRWYILCVPKRAGVGVVCMRKRERERERSRRRNHSCHEENTRKPSDDRGSSNNETHTFVTEVSPEFHKYFHDAVDAFPLCHPGIEISG